MNSLEFRVQGLELKVKRIKAKDSVGRRGRFIPDAENIYNRSHFNAIKSAYDFLETVRTFLFGVPS